MRIPQVKPRRYYDKKAFGKTYMESDLDWIANNRRACLWFLENREKVKVAIDEAQQ